jgi:hypothetical protein
MFLLTILTVLVSDFVVFRFSSFSCPAPSWLLPFWISAALSFLFTLLLPSSVIPIIFQHEYFKLKLSNAESRVVCKVFPRVICCLATVYPHPADRGQSLLGKL